jgi:hypothetical protein
VALGSLQDVARSAPGTVQLGVVAGNIALWASVSEGRSERAESSRDLVLLCAAATLSAALFAGFVPLLHGTGRAGPEWMLVTGAFLVGYLKRFGMLGAGIGSQIYIGQLLALSSNLGPADLWGITIAGLIAVPASVVPRVLSGPAEEPVPFRPIAPRQAFGPGTCPPELAMGLQAACGAIVVVLLNQLVGLEQSAWAITACVYVVAGTAAGTVDRVRRRIVGTAIGVPLGIACLPLAEHAPLLIWSAAAFAMIIYAMALPERYDISCGVLAFTLMVTMAASGVHSIPLLAARAWETLLGGILGIAAAMLIFPLHLAQREK